MSYQIRYTSKWDGSTRVHNYRGNEAGARGWAETLSKDNGGRRAECVRIDDGPYDFSNKVTHVITVGHDD